MRGHSDLRLSPVPGQDLIPYSGPYWGPEEVEAGCAALRDGGRWISSGKHVAQFEREFSRTFGQTSSLMVNSGSSANLIMLSAAKRHFAWENHDEVIVSAVGFPTTVAPVVQCGLKPVFCDIEFDTLNFALNEVEAKITSRTRALLVSPVLGNPPDFFRLTEFCEAHRLTLLLDGCDSLGSLWATEPLSSYAFATTCSFFPSHHISTGEGGMVSSRNEEFITLARKFAHWGRDCYCVGAANSLPKGTCGKRFSAHLGESCGVVDHKYVFSEIGFNLKPLDLQGAIGLEQLKRFPLTRALRRSNYSRIASFLRRHRPDLKVPKELPHAETNWFGIPIVCPDQQSKENLVAHLESAKIQTRHYFAGNLLLHPGYSHLGEAKDYPQANEVLRRVFFIGCHPSYSAEVLSYVEEHFL